jgi:Zn-dependent protease
LFDDFNLQSFILMMGVLIIAITIHEFAHAITADRLGDPTPRSQGRISLLPPDHLDPIGTIMMVVSSLTGFGIGWGKPVMCNDNNFANPRKGGAIVAVAGPISNVLQAVVFSLLLRVLLATGNDNPQLAMFALLGIQINLGLALFNMLPIGPLDGHWVVQGVLPQAQSDAYRRFNDAYGFYIFLGIVFLGRDLLWQVLGPPMKFAVSLLLYGIVPG